MKYKQSHTDNFRLFWLFPYLACSRDQSIITERTLEISPVTKGRGVILKSSHQPVLGASQVFISVNRNESQRTEIKWNVTQCELKTTSLSTINCCNPSEVPSKPPLLPNLAPKHLWIATERPQMALTFMARKRWKSHHLPGWHWRVQQRTAHRLMHICCSKPLSRSLLSPPHPDLSKS